MTYETIRVDRDGPLLTITLNRPERLNAMPPQMADEIGQVFYDLGDARAVLITGEGKGFCSGADLSARGEASALGGKGGSHEALINHYNPAISQVVRASVPVGCAHGVVHAELAAHAQVRGKHQVGVIGRQPQELAPPTGAGHCPPRQHSLEVPGPLGLAPDAAWVQDMDATDPHALDMCSQPPADDLHLGQFGHQDTACSGWATVRAS